MYPQNSDGCHPYHEAQSPAARPTTAATQPPPAQPSPQSTPQRHHKPHSTPPALAEKGWGIDAVHALADADARSAVEACPQCGGAWASLSGAIQGFPIQQDEHLLTVLRYVERNPLRAKLVEAAEDWRWGSCYVAQRRGHACAMNCWPIGRWIGRGGGWPW